MMHGKREVIAKTFARFGITSVLEAMPKRRLLMILNYHRVGNADETPYDSGTFSCTAEQFDWQIGYLKRNCRFATLAETLEILDGRMEISRPTVLVTFDDGYIDNYKIAFPILRQHNVKGAFFLPTAFVGTGRLPWWDVIAYIVKHSRSETFCLEYPERRRFDLTREGANSCIMRILKLYTQSTMQDQVRFMEGLEQACDSLRPSSCADRCFLSWDEAREMRGAGMAFGSHTHTHEILSKISTERQREELLVSREILEHELGDAVDTLAYPVGALETFSPDTIRTLCDTGYRAAFSFYGGFNKPGQMQPFNLLRVGVDVQSSARLRLQTALGAFSGTYWF